MKSSQNVTIEGRTLTLGQDPRTTGQVAVTLRDGKYMSAVSGAYIAKWCHKQNAGKRLFAGHNVR